MSTSNLPLHQEERNNTGWKKKAAMFLSSQGMSLFGSMLVQYAIIWYVTLTTESGVMLTISTISGFLPQIVISIFAGVWADRYPRKRLIIFADALTATSTLILALFFIMGYKELWLIFMVSGIRSIGAGIQAPAVGALLPQIVPQDKLLKVNGVNSTMQPFIMITAPILSGALLSFSRLEAIFLIDIVTAAIAIGLLGVIQVPPHAKAAAGQKTDYLEDLRSGLKYVAGNRPIKMLFLFYAVVFFLVAPAAFLSPLMVARSFGEEVWRLTANEVAFFGGSIVGGVIMTAWGGFKNHFRTIGLSCILWAVLFAGLGVANVFVVYLIMMFLAGIPMPFLNVPTTTLLQEMVAQDMQGRVFGVIQLIMTTVMPVGMLVFGPIADVVRIETLLILSGLLMGLPGLWVFFKGQVDKAQPARASRDYKMQPGD